MIPEERRQKLIDRLKVNGLCTINKLVDDFKVSRVTIQRDIDILRRMGLVEKIHGGVKIRRNEEEIETQFKERLKNNYEKKLSIAIKAVDYVHDGDIIFLDNSTTVYIFAMEVFKKKRDCFNLTLITNSPAIIKGAIMSNTDINIISTGGQLDIEWQMYKGTWVVEFLKKINIDKAFISTGGITDSGQITTVSRDLANTLGSVIEKVKEVNLLLDSSKFSRTAMINISDIKDFARVITDCDFNKDSYPDLDNIVLAG